MIEKYLLYLQEVYDYKKEHGHNRCKVNSICWHFHNYEHGYKHCKGGPKNPYTISHNNNMLHIITTQYARGHSFKRKPVWFKFTKKIKNGWLLESGKLVNIKKVPNKFK